MKSETLQSTQAIHQTKQAQLAKFSQTLNVLNFITSVKEVWHLLVWSVICCHQNFAKMKLN